MSQTETRTCYRHPSRETGVSCSSCGRPICPDCMTPTQVGMRCPECARQRTSVRTLRTMRTEPRVTLTLIAINVIVFLASGQFNVASQTHGQLTNSVYQHLLLWGPYIHDQHEYWRLVTAGFLHAGFLHIFFNMYILYVLGVQLEPAIGSGRFLTIYMVSLLAGSFGSLLQAPHDPVVGASGAVFGIAGAFAVELRERGLSLFAGGIGFFIIANLVLGFSLPGVSWGGHIAGLIAGAACGEAFHIARRRQLPAFGYAGCLAVALASVAGAIAVAPAATVPLLPT